MKILACIKVTPDDQDITVREDNTISLEKAPYKIGAFDLNAIEAGKQFADANGGELIGLSVGGAALEATKLRKDILSRGLDGLYAIIGDDFETGDSFQTASRIAAGYKKIQDIDLVICGAGSADRYAQEVGNQLGEILELPVVNGVNAFELDGNKIRAERVTENTLQVLEIPLPAVICVTSEINTPRIPGMKDILAGGKKPFTPWTKEDIATDIAASTQVTSILAPQQAARQNLIIEGDSDAKISEFVDAVTAALK